MLQLAVFIGANTQASTLAYDPATEIVAYGAGKCIALWKPAQAAKNGVFATLKGHSATVTALQFVCGTDFLVSGGEDHAVNVWKYNGLDYDLFQLLTGHANSVTAVAVGTHDTFATGGADGFVILWRYAEGVWREELRTVVQPGFLPLSIALQPLDDGAIMAVGGTTSKIFVYTVAEEEHGRSREQSSTSSESSGSISTLAVTLQCVLTGHEDWIKALSFVQQEEGNYILASGSQDRYIRLWRLCLDDKIDDTDEDGTRLVLLSNKQHKFRTKNHRASFAFDALLMGHDDWVSGLQWNPLGQLQLVSSSADTAVMVWEMDTESGVWCSISRLGEMSIKGASTATGSSGGFWSCLWFVSDHHEYIMANGKTGAIRTYRKEGGSWEPQISVSGPVRSVTDIKWAPCGYFMATSLDQTTRLYAQWNQDQTWHEFARPQIHGYDMVCVDYLSNEKFVSGGEEKVLRVFEMTHLIGRLLDDACGIKMSISHLPESASLPVLGLSNKAEKQMETGEYQEDTSEPDGEVPVKEEPEALAPVPPLEDILQRYTLFPEQEKLYGHGYEISSVAVSPNGSLIASACRSNTSRHSVIRVFNAAHEFKQSSQLLEGHNLTITQLKFSSDGQNLLAVSRDRQMSVWRVVEESSARFELVELCAKPHTKIIWDCCWVPDHNLFLTASRDKLVKLWELGEKIEMVSSVKLQDSVTAIDCKVEGNGIVVAAGMESGAIVCLRAGLHEPLLAMGREIDHKLTPAGRVSRLGFHGTKLAVGSWDHSIRIYDVEEKTE